MIAWNDPHVQDRRDSHRTFDDASIIANGTVVTYHGSLRHEYGPACTFIVVGHETGRNGVTYLVSANDGSDIIDMLRWVRPTSISQ
jgi:hypothetical protein